MFKYGIISEVKKGYAKAYFEEDNIVSDWLPVLVRKSKSEKESWQLEINEHVVCLMDENCNEGVILGAIPNDEDAPDAGEAAGKFRKVFSDGTVIEYDKGAHKLTVDVQGEIEAKTTGKVKVDAGTSIEAIAGTSAKIQAGTSIEAIATTSAKVEAGTTLDAKAGVKATVEAVNIELKGIVTVTGTLMVTGTATIAALLTAAGITATGDIITTGDVKIGPSALPLLTHKHGGVQTGSGTSGTPIP